MITADKTTINLKEYVINQTKLANDFFDLVFSKETLEEISNGLEISSKNGDSSYQRKIIFTKNSELNLSYFFKKIKEYFFEYGYKDIIIYYYSETMLVLTIIFNYPDNYLV